MYITIFSLSCRRLPHKCPATLQKNVEIRQFFQGRQLKSKCWCAQMDRNPFASANNVVKDLVEMKWRPLLSKHDKSAYKSFNKFKLIPFGTGFCTLYRVPFPLKFITAGAHAAMANTNLSGWVPATSFVFSWLAIIIFICVRSARRTCNLTCDSCMKMT